MGKDHPARLGVMWGQHVETSNYCRLSRLQIISLIIIIIIIIIIITASLDEWSACLTNNHEVVSIIIPGSSILEFLLLWNGSTQPRDDSWVSYLIKKQWIWLRKSTLINQAERNTNRIFLLLFPECFPVNSNKIFKSFPDNGDVYNTVNLHASWINVAPISEVHVCESPCTQVRHCAHMPS